MSRANRDVDVVIAGGGMVGCSLALALEATALRVAIVEASAPAAASPPSFDERHTALAPSTQRVFEALGLWPKLASEAAAITSIHVSDRGHFGFTRIRAADEGLPALGWVVPNRVIGSHLLPRLAGGPRRRWLRPASIAEVSTDADGVSVEVDTDSGREALRGRLLVVAEGADSATRGRLGIASRVRDYEQTAVVTNLCPGRPAGGRAFERFTPQGPIAVLPAPGGRCAVIWTLPPDVASAVLEDSDAAFLARLQDAFGYRLGRFREVGARGAYPLAVVAAERCVGERSVIVGNAAHTLHPVAGQGFNLAVRDVATLAELIAAANDPGSASCLAAYAARRHADYRRTLGFTDGLVRIFSNNLPVLRGGRSAVLVGLDLLPALRQRVVRRAMGRGGWLPRLARGLPLTEDA